MVPYDSKYEIFTILRVLTKNKLRKCEIQRRERLTRMGASLGFQNPGAPFKSLTEGNFYTALSIHHETPFETPSRTRCTGLGKVWDRLKVNAEPSRSP